MERIAWFRSCALALRRELARRPALVRWRRRTGHALECEALLLAFDQGATELSWTHLAQVLGLTADQVRATGRRAVRTGVFVESGQGIRLTRAGRRRLGELERAYAEAVADLVGTLEGDMEPVSVQALIRLWTRIDALAGPEPLG